ncbi:MAG: undecaprenyl-diphosphatase UppP, partial [Myxococcales bacterium]
MTLLEALVLGAVQGLTEFLPISSTAHLRVVPALLGWDDPGAAYSAVIQLGTTAAVIVYFARDLGRIVSSVLLGLKKRTPMIDDDARIGWYVAFGTIPIVFFGLALKKYIENEWRSLYVIAGAAVGLAIVLFLAERFARHTRGMQELRFSDGMLIGLAQAVALVPGASRSGVTLTAGLMLGLRRDAAARFSFLLSIPATTAAGVYELKHLVEALKLGQGPGVGAMIVGTVASFLFGYG